jgi:Cu(I)/Ag(I) efflux system membrane protein CusA/SilA
VISKLIEYSARNRFLVLLLIFFASAWGVWALTRVPLDAIPDLSDAQVIVYTEWPGRSPQIMEDQITYPIVSSLIAAPRVKYVRGISMVGDSFVYVVFEDGTDIYWARSRVLEYMQGLGRKLPEGVTPTLGPDATGVGWVFQYALVDESGRRSLAELRTLQDWYLRYWLSSMPGVAEVATVGGFVKQYQVTVDPQALLAYGLPLKTVVEAIRRSNNEVGGRVLEVSGVEHFVRGLGYIRSLQDIEIIPVGTDGKGTPILVRDIGQVQLGPDLRRGIAELNGEGEVVGGVVVMRYGENALTVIRAVKEKLEEVKCSLPEGVSIVTTYDRSHLILRAIDTLKATLGEEMIVVSLVIIIFLFHLRSSLIPIFTLPIAVLLSFIPMYYLGVTANIMSLGGIAIAIGAMVDAAIIMVENAHKRLDEWQQAHPLPHPPPSRGRVGVGVRSEEGQVGSREEVIIEAFKEVGTPIFFALLVITVSFIPIFVLEAQEGRLFKPLAYTKTFSMAFAALLAVTLTPALATFLIRGRIHPEESHPVSRVLIALYHPVVAFAVRFRKTMVVAAVVVMALSFPLFTQLGSEFMPPLNEGTILYMPTALPGLSVTEARQVLQTQDQLLKRFPEVETVFGKIGRSNSPTDPAPLNMVETVVTLKPPEEWRTVPVERWYSSWAPAWLKPPLNWLWPEERSVTWDELLKEMDRTLKFPGMTNIFWMPIQTRTEMLATGIRSVLGIKAFGPDLESVEQAGLRIEAVLAPLRGTRSVYYDRAVGGYYLDFEVRRAEAARYGLTVGDVQDIIETAIGGKNITWTVEGRERYAVNLRYPRELRDDMENLKRTLVHTPAGALVPMAQLADIRYTSGPPMVRDEDAQLVGYVFVDVAGRDLGGYVAEAKQTVAERVQLPPGVHLAWAGQFQYLERAKEKLMMIVPFTLLLVFVLLYLNTGSVTKTVIVLLAVPFSLVGAVWLLYLLDYNMSVAVWVGLIALAGLDAETGVVMLLYLDLAYEQMKREGRMKSFADLREAVMQGAVKRIRPKMMTVTAILVGLLPIMWGHGTGADVMKRIAAPMIGGVITSGILELLIYPAIYTLWKWRWEVRPAAQAQGG